MQIMIDRNNFPALKNGTYLNTASSGILSEGLHAWRAGHDLEFLQTGSHFRLQQAQFLEGVKDTVSDFFKGDRKHTYLVQNFSIGFQALLNGLQGKHKFLLLENEYPAVYYPIVSKGWETIKVQLGEDLEERIKQNIAQHKPTIFAFSLVQYTNGIRLSNEFLQELKEAYPQVLLMADGTQYCGTESFNFNNSPLDALLASGYKWMLGGYGNGFVLLKEELASQLYSEPSASLQPSEAFLAYKDKLSLRFEPGHHDTLAFGSLQQSLLQLKTISLSSIEDRIKDITHDAKNAFSERGLLDDYIVQREQHSTIFRLNIDTALVERIAANNIVGTVRGAGLRVSFHFYNTKEDLKNLLDVLDEAL